jgi:transposase-like protein
LAEAFGYQHRQNIQNGVQEFEQGAGDGGEYLRRRRKVDATIVEAVTEAVRHTPLATESALCECVSARLGRSDLTSANIHAALEQIACPVIRTPLRQQWERGAFHPKEAVGLEEALTILLQASASLEGIRVAEQLQALGVSSAEAAEDGVVQRQQEEAVWALLNPRVAVSQISGRIQVMVLALTLYFWNLPLSRIGLWLGVAKGTVYQWVSGLAVALFPVVQAWIVGRGQALKVAGDEKWLKIRKTWYYWFVVWDEDTGLPVLSRLLPTRTTWACCWVLVLLKRLGKVPQAVISDGLAGYAASVCVVFPTAKHLVCLFHHQQGVSRWLREHADRLPEDVVATLKRKMKQVVQTIDPRTVRRRLARLAAEDVAQQYGLDTWLARTQERLGQLVPALRRNSYPRTTNTIERFFRAFQRFYKTRGGFYSVVSAKRELMLFVVVYVFTKQVSTGLAPLERIVPQTAQMPVDHLLNDPFRYGLANICQAKNRTDVNMAIQPTLLQLKNP